VALVLPAPLVSRSIIPPRIKQHKVLTNWAAPGQDLSRIPLVGQSLWFFGCKLPWVVNDKGDLLNFTLTPGITDDRTPVPQLMQRLFSKVFGDKGVCLTETGKAISRKCEWRGALLRLDYKATLPSKWCTVWMGKSTAFATLASTHCRLLDTACA